ncbi:MAG: M14/M99 family metallopeptidase [Deltaproteobacteria bacterium]
MKRVLLLVFALLLFLAGPASASNHIDFTIHKLESNRPGNTLLVIGGIQGDEPGGFNAAALLATQYKIKKGSVWVVPNLNFISIIKRSRGVFGDLNRKFAQIGKNDPEFDTISKVKRIILDKQVDLILNLHDGSGFYRPSYVDRTHNPNRWGQSIIIDQEEIEAVKFGDLGEIARQVQGVVNRHLISAEHAYHVKDTWTKLGDLEMAKTLTYYAVTNFKPAFGVEVSKNFPTHKRTYYHLQVIETYMDLLGIEYERSFNLSAKGVKGAIYNNVRLAFYDNRIFLDVTNARARLGYLPLRKAGEIVYRSSNPLIALVESGGGFRVFHGNRRITRIYPEYFEYDFSTKGITVQIDGEERKVAFGDMLGVQESFMMTRIIHGNAEKWLSGICDRLPISGCFR